MCKENGRSANQNILVSSRMEEEKEEYLRLKQNEVETKTNTFKQSGRSVKGKKSWITGRRCARWRDVFGKF